MLEGSCHCGQVTWRFDGVPTSATACNCTVCRRYGVLWAYDFEGERIHVAGPTRAYAWGERSIGFHFCEHCGCIAYWRGIQPRADGPDQVADIAMRHFNGLEWKETPSDGRRVADMWF